MSIGSLGATLSSDLYRAVQGKHFNLTCHVYGNSSESTFMWRKLDEGVIGHNVKQINNILKFSNIKLENRGIYECTVESMNRIAKAYTIVDIECEYL